MTPRSTSLSSSGALLRIHWILSSKTSTKQLHDISFIQTGDSAWRVVRPPRRRFRSAFHGTASVLAGFLLASACLVGIVNTLQGATLGMAVFFVSWLGPLVIVGGLLIWLGTRLIVRAWQVDVLESDGETVYHRFEGPMGRMEFETPLATLERLELPDIPKENAASFRGPLRLRARVPKGDSFTQIEHVCFTDTTYDEYRFLVTKINRMLPEVSGEDGEPAA